MSFDSSSSMKDLEESTVGNIVLHVVSNQPEGSCRKQLRNQGVNRGGLNFHGRAQARSHAMHGSDVSSTPSTLPYPKLKNHPEAEPGMTNSKTAPIILG